MGVSKMNGKRLGSVAFQYNSLLLKTIFNDYRQIKLCHCMGVFDHFNQIQRRDGVSYLF